jgi:replication factor C subunit 1
VSSVTDSKIDDLLTDLCSKVTGTPSGNTNYVVIGENAGPSKLKKIEELGVPSITEAQFYDLIRYRPSGGVLTDKQKEAQLKAEQQMKEEASRMAQQEKETEKAQARKAKVAGREGLATKSVHQQVCNFHI